MIRCFLYLPRALKIVSLLAAFAGDADSMAADRVQFFTPPDVYPEYLATTYHPYTGVLAQYYSRVGIVGARRQRPLLSLGGSFGVVGGSFGANGQWRANVDVGMRAQFDRKNSEDMTGWDGTYGASVRFAWRDDLAVKVGLMHVSAHVGDEYVIRTGIERAGYTRNEWVLGTAWTPRPGFTAYLEGAYAHGMGASFQEPGRAQIGWQYHRPRSLFTNRVGWFVGSDFISFEERGFDVTTSIAAGLLLGAPARYYRFGIEWGTGRPPFGEFYDDDETYIGLGLRADLATWSRM